jgi:poly-gamma-glutamate synthesis protein (capsule biosynthesis protein)
MLARHVEVLARDHGLVYPYTEVRRLHLRYPSVVANFEGAVPERHEPTPSKGLQFSVDREMLGALADAGVTHLSLANNHTLDFGAAGYRTTTDALAGAGFEAFGHPTRVGSESITYIDAGAVRVALIGVHTLWQQPSAEALETLFAEANTHADAQIVVVHWGVEYALTHDDAQETFAHDVIDLGADAVIGMHPHVVQDIGWYAGTPIFYSLGNYVFDQYWNDEVQSGLAVGLGVYLDEITYELIPIVSDKSVPSVRVGDDRDAFLAELARRSDPAIASDIARGRLSSGY